MEFYREMNPTDFESKKEIIDFAERNENLVYFYLDNGESTIEPALMFHIERFFVNKDRIFMVGDNAIKLFPVNIIIDRPASRELGGFSTGI